MNLTSSSRSRPRPSLLTALERARGVPIRDLLDAAAYRALGASNTTPGAPDEATIDWALQATVARVADRATEGHRLLLLAWVRQGEASRRPAAFEPLDAATEALLERAWALLSPATRTGNWKDPVRLGLRVEELADLAREGLTPAVLLRACAFYTVTELAVEPGDVEGALWLTSRGYGAGPAGDH